MGTLLPTGIKDSQNRKEAIHRSSLAIVRTMPGFCESDCDLCLNRQDVNQLVISHGGSR